VVALLPANDLPAFGAGVHFYGQPLNQTHDTFSSKSEKPAISKGRYL
jgi:hypothetical protein